MGPKMKKIEREPGKITVWSDKEWLLDLVQVALQRLKDTHHIVEVTPGGDWTILHPLSESLDGSIFDCALHDLLFESGPAEGTFGRRCQVEWDSDRGEWVWEDAWT